MTRTRKLLPALLGATALVFTAALPATAGHRPGATVYRADLQEVADNDADGTPSGTVTIVKRGDEIRVNLDAEGLDDGVHISHIHGADDADNTCPTAGEDANEDGLVDLVEGLAVYGGIVTTLGGGEDVGTDVEFSRTFEAPDDDLEDLHVVLHGVDLDTDGTIDAPFASSFAEDEGTMPALCGEIVKISN